MKFGGGTGYYGSNRNQWGEEISRSKNSSSSTTSNTSGSTWAPDKAAREAKQKAEREKKVMQEHEQNLKAAINKASIYNDVMLNPERLYLEGLEIFNLSSMRTSVESIYRKNGFDTAKHNLNYALLFGELRAFEPLLDLYPTGKPLATFLIMIARELGVAEMSDKVFLKHKVEDTSCLNSVQKCAEIIRQNAKKYGSSIITTAMQSEAIAAYNDGLEVKYQLLSPAQVRNMNIQAHTHANSWEKGLEWKNDFSDTKVAVIQKGDFACGILQKTICNTNFTLMVHSPYSHYSVRIT